MIFLGKRENGIAKVYRIRSYAVGQSIGYNIAYEPT